MEVFIRCFRRAPRSQKHSDLYFFDESDSPRQILVKFATVTCSNAGPPTDFGTMQKNRELAASTENQLARAEKPSCSRCRTQHSTLRRAPRNAPGNPRIFAPCVFAAKKAGDDIRAIADRHRRIGRENPWAVKHRDIDEPMDCDREHVLVEIW